MKKRFGVSLIAVLLVLGSTMALAASGQFSLNLSEAQELAQANDLQIVLDELDIEDKVDDLASAQEDAAEIDFIVGLPETRLKAKFTKFVEPLQAEYDLEMAQLQETENREQLEIEVEKAYQSLWLVYQELEKEQYNLQVAEVEYHSQEIRFQKGQITATELASSQYDLENQKLKLRQLEYDLRNAQYELNQLTGKPLEDLIVIEDEITLMLPEELDLDLTSSYEEALQNSLSIKQKKISAEIADLKFQYTAEEYSELRDEYQDAWYNRELERIALEEAEANLWLALNQDYNQLLNDLDSYNLQQTAEEIKAKEYQIAKAEYELGKISKLSLMQSEQKWLEAQYTLKATMIKINSNWLGFCQQYAINQ